MLIEHAGNLARESFAALSSDVVANYNTRTGHTVRYCVGLPERVPEKDRGSCVFDLYGSAARDELRVWCAFARTSLDQPGY